MCMQEPWLVLLSLLIGWKSGVRTVNLHISLSEVNAKPKQFANTFDTIKNRSQWGFLSRQSVHTLSINTKEVGTFLIGGGEGGASEGVSRSSLILEGMYLREGQAYRYNWGSVWGKANKNIRICMGIIKKAWEDNKMKISPIKKPNFIAIVGSFLPGCVVIFQISRDFFLESRNNMVSWSQCDLDLWEWGQGQNEADSIVMSHPPPPSWGVAGRALHWSDVYLPLLRKEVWGTPQLNMMSNVI